MKITDMFPRKYVTGEDLQGKPVTLVISRLGTEEMRPGPGAQPQTKFVVYFEQAKKGVILSRTLATQIAEIAGSDDTDNWIGKKVTLYPQPMTVAGRQVVAIRARKPAPESPAPQAGQVAGKNGKEATQQPSSTQNGEQQPAGSRPYSPEATYAKLVEIAGTLKDAPADPGRLSLLRHGLELCFAGEQDAKKKAEIVLVAILNHTGLASDDDRLLRACIGSWLELAKTKDGSGEYTINPMAAKEARLIEKVR